MTNKLLDKVKGKIIPEDMGIAGIVIQVILGFAVAIFVYWISLQALRADSLIVLQTDPNVKSTTNIIMGYAESSQVASQSFNTVNSFATSYIPINPSSNIKGGAQFTYSLWLNVGNLESARKKVIFMRGDRQKYTYNKKTGQREQDIEVKDYVSFCPMLEFGSMNGVIDFNVRFNTSREIDEQLNINSTTSSNSIYRSNMMSLLTKQWFLITLVFEDNIPINDFENGLSVKFYVNNALYKSQTYPAMLKQNNGNLFMFPSGSVDNCKISNFKYYNYALGPKEIAANATDGPSSTAQKSVTSSFIQPLALSDYNSMDIYNT